MPGHLIRRLRRIAVRAVPRSSQGVRVHAGAICCARMPSTTIRASTRRAVPCHRARTLDHRRCRRPPGEQGPDHATAAAPLDRAHQIAATSRAAARAAAWPDIEPAVEAPATPDPGAAQAEMSEVPSCAMLKQLVTSEQRTQPGAAAAERNPAARRQTALPPRSRLAQAREQASPRPRRRFRNQRSAG